MIKSYSCAFALCVSCFALTAVGQTANLAPQSSPTKSEPDSNPTTGRQTTEPQEQEPSSDSESKAEPKEGPKAEPKAEPSEDPREFLVVKMRDEYWEAKDKKGAKRKAEPALFDAHEQMTRQWVKKLSDEDFGILTAEDPSDDQAKRVKELLREYNKKSQEIATRLTLARRLAKKIMQAHWQSLEQTGVLQNTVPEYARDYENAVESWFLSRSIEDLKIFEKTRPSKSERERGDKITAELIEKIDEVKKKYEGNMR